MKKLFLLVILFLFIGCDQSGLKHPSSIDTSTLKESSVKKKALIIGVGNYYSNKLYGVDKDIRSVSMLFRKWHFGVRILKGSYSLKILDRLKEYQSLSPNDVFVLYFSGNGFHLPDKNGDEKSREDGAIALSDSRRDYLLLDDALFKYLNKIKAKKLIILDTCYYNREDFNGEAQVKALFNGADYQILKTEQISPENSILSGENYILISSSKRDKISLIASDGSLFTNALVESIKGGADKKSFLELKSDVENRLSNSSSKFGYTQTPIFNFSNQQLKDISLKEFLKIDR